MTTLSVVAESGLETPAANVLNTFQSHVPAHAGEVIGFYFPSPNNVPCAATSQPGYTTDFASGDLAPGTNNVGFNVAAGRDVIAALGGNDKVLGLGDDDIICGGPGKDTLKGGAGNDKLIGGPGKDTLKGGPGKDKLKGGPGKDKQIQ